MPNSKDSIARVSQIVALLKRSPSTRLPESLTDAALVGDVARMQLFVERGANLEQRSIGFASPLAAACSVGCLDAIRWLIERGALLDPAGAIVSPIDAALGKGNCAAAALLLDAGLPVERAAWGVGAAAVTGNVPMLRWLIGRGIDLDRSYPRLGRLRDYALRNAEKNGQMEVAAIIRGETPLGQPPDAPPAAIPIREMTSPGQDEKHLLLEEALALLRAGGKAAAKWTAIRAAGSKNELLISFAAQAGVIEIVRALLDAGAKADVAAPGTPPPLFRAAEEAHEDIVGLLLDRGASPDGADGKSWLPLVAALRSGEPKIARILLEAGANAKAKPAGGGTLEQNVRGPYAQEITALLAQYRRVKKPAQKKRSNENEAARVDDL
jgi:ankyrin repeat protein